jgi:hypothetical protein
MTGNKRYITEWMYEEEIIHLVYTDFMQSITKEQAYAILESDRNGTLVWTDKHIRSVGKRSFSITKDGQVWQS